MAQIGAIRRGCGLEGRLRWRPLLACDGHRYSSVTCPNRRSRCLSLNLPSSKSVVRLNATEPAWPNTFQSPCARCTAAAGLVQSMGSPAAMPPPSSKSKGNATKKVISAIRSHFVSFFFIAHSGRHRLNRREAPRFLHFFERSGTFLTGSELPPRAELIRIGDRCGKCLRADRPDAGETLPILFSDAFLDWDISRRSFIRAGTHRGPIHDLRNLAAFIELHRDRIAALYSIRRHDLQ
jgi:hypothetical protein